MDKTPPRYLTLAEALRTEVSVLPPNVLLPSEDQLAKQHNVSRVTMRRALGLLEQDGLLNRQRGRGTTISPPKVTRTLFPTLPIEEDFARQGLRLQSEVLSLKVQAPSPRVQKALGLGDDETVGVIELLRRVDNRVICVDRRYLREATAKRVDLSRVGKTPIAVLIAACAQSPVAFHDWELTFYPSMPDVATLLGVTAGSLIVVSHGIDYLEDSSALCAIEVSYRIDRVNFTCSSPYRLDTSKEVP